MVFNDEDKILIKKFVFEGGHTKELDRRISGEKLDIDVVLKSCDHNRLFSEPPMHILSKKITMPSYAYIFRIFC